MKNEHTRSAETVFALSLLVLFAGLSLLLVMIGGSTYRTIVARMNRNNELRTSLSYVANKVRAAGSTAELRTESGVHTLVLREAGETAVYETYIYTYEGALCEYYTTEGEPFAPDRGERLIEGGALAFEVQDGLLTVVLTQTDGTAESVTLRLRSASGG